MKMQAGNGGQIEAPPDKEEVDNLACSIKKVKVQGGNFTKEQEEIWKEADSLERKRKKSYRDLLLQSYGDEPMGDEDSKGEDDFSDDDIDGEEEDSP